MIVEYPCHQDKPVMQSRVILYQIWLGIGRVGGVMLGLSDIFCLLRNGTKSNIELNSISGIFI